MNAEYSILTQKIKETYIGFNFPHQLIKVWSLIKSCWLENTLNLNFGSKYTNHLLMPFTSKIFSDKKIR